MAATDTQVAKHPRTRVATYLNETNQTIRGCITLFDNLLSNASINEELRSDLKSHLWSFALETSLQKSIEREKDGSSEDAGTLADRVRDLSSHGLEPPARQIARLQFAAKRFEDALLTLGTDDGSDLYRDSQALSIIAHAGAVGHIVNSSDARIVGDFHFRNKKFRLASDSFRAAGDTERALDCLRLGVEPAEKAGASDILRNVVEVLIADGQLSLLVSLLAGGQPRQGKDKRWGKATSAAVLEVLTRDNLLLTCVVPLLAKSDKLSSADVKSRQEVSEFLASRLLRRGAIASWWESLPRRTAGAAIERAGKDIDALEFYEKWRDGATASRDREYAENRWVICKLRQARRQEAEGSTKKASSNRHSAVQVMQKYGWKEHDIVEKFPEVDEGARPAREAVIMPGVVEHKLPTASELREGDTGQLGSIGYRFIPAKNWVNLESKDGLCARVLLRASNVTSKDVIFHQDGESSYRCDEWDLRVSWLSGSAVILTHGTESREISFGERQDEGS